jgi:endonuclease YncB( thermonuclease family)
VSFIIIKGVFNPKSGVPDGDSVRFLANNDALFNQLEGQVEFKSGAEVQLRYEGIDALEKAAIKPFSSDATKRNIELLGGDQNELPGFILSSRAEKNGRPVCFVFKGDSPSADGESIFLESDLLKQSVNYKLLADGVVYPLFYETLYKELRDEMTKAVQASRQGKKGIWTEDASTKGFIIKSPVDLAELPPIFPKLWRRLQAFYGRPSNKNKTVKEFVASLKQGTDRVFTVPDQRSVKFATVIEANQDQLKLLYKPEDLIFRE